MKPNSISYYIISLLLLSASCLVAIDTSKKDAQVANTRTTPQVAVVK